MLKFLRKFFEFFNFLGNKKTHLKLPLTGLVIRDKVVQAIYKDISENFVHDKIMGALFVSKNRKNSLVNKYYIPYRSDHIITYTNFDANSVFADSITVSVKGEDDTIYRPPYPQDVQNLLIELYKRAEVEDVERHMAKVKSDNNKIAKLFGLNLEN